MKGKCKEKCVEPRKYGFTEARYSRNNTESLPKGRGRRWGRMVSKCLFQHFSTTIVFQYLHLLNSYQVEFYEALARATNSLKLIWKLFRPA